MNFPKFLKKLETFSDQQARPEGRGMLFSRGG
jgi:hypothetical protein